MRSKQQYCKRNTEITKTRFLKYKKKAKTRCIGNFPIHKTNFIETEIQKCTAKTTKNKTKKSITRYKLNFFHSQKSHQRIEKNWGNNK